MFGQALRPGRLRILQRLCFSQITTFCFLCKIKSSAYSGFPPLSPTPAITFKTPVPLHDRLIKHELNRTPRLFRFVV